MDPARGRALLVVLGCVLGGLLALPFLRLRKDYGGAVLLGDPAAFAQLLRERALPAAREDGASAHGAATDGGEPRLAREPIDEAEARRLFRNLASSQLRYDPYVYFVRRPHLDLRVPMKEHPRGGWRLRTNGLGLREDDELPSAPIDLRVVVVGDSHVEGVCDNAESFPNRLEALLRRRRPDRSVDVVNAGQGGYSFYQYLGMLERLLAAGVEPDVFVLVVYGGNDFRGLLRLRHYFRRSELPIGSPEETRRLQRAQEVDRNAVAQFLFQLSYFRRFPEQADEAAVGALAVTREILRLCRAHDIVPIAAYLPSAVEVQPERYWPREAARLLGVEPHDVAITRRLADAWLAGCRSLGLATLDLRETFAAVQEPLYWTTDAHINLAAHERIARAFLPLVEPYLAPRGG